MALSKNFPIKETMGFQFRVRRSFNIFNNRTPQWNGVNNSISLYYGGANNSPADSSCTAAGWAGFL